MKALYGFVFEGNSDPPELLERLEADCSHLRVLRDELTATTVKDRQITIAGNRLWWSSEASRRVAQELEERPGDDVRLLLTHQPDAVYNLKPDSRVDLVVAGHTHGGQVVIPFLGLPLITFSTVPHRIAAGGLGMLDGTRVYVSRGIGMERGQAPPLRFFCPPEISLLTLR